MNIRTSLRQFSFFLLFSLSVTCVLTQLAIPSVAALTNEQQTIYNEGINFFDVAVGDSSTTCGDDGTSSATVTSSGSSQSGSEFSLDQVKTFASEPVTSTWNISDSTVEQWFLKTNTVAISKYGLNSSNIGAITSAVKAAGVSPEFFYAYTVNEGGGDGGFINHFPTDTGQGAAADATRDAQYLASQSKVTNGVPSTGGGEPADMPTAEAQQILNALPSGSIGVVYIQATAAVTAELEYLSGKTGDWNPADSASPATIYGSPLAETMQDIKAMGGDPEQGGTTISTTGSDCAADDVAGQGMAKAISWAEQIANNSGYGYSQAARTTGWTKYQSDPSCRTQCGFFDCSSFVAAALTEAGYFKTNPNFDTTSEGPDITAVGFKDVTSSVNLTTDEGMQPGDILVNTGEHTAIYIGNDQLVQAADPIEGIDVRSFYPYPWTNVYRASN